MSFRLPSTNAWAADYYSQRQWKHIATALRLLESAARGQRLPLIATLTIIVSAVNAQFLQEAKPTKFGTGCIERIKSNETALGACMIGEARSRVWCPNGEVYERDGDLPDSPLIRSVCGLNQLR
jgi:hypothetical protein